MSFDLNLNVVAICRSGEAVSAMNEACTNMNGTKVDVHLGRLQDVKPGVRMLEGLDILFLEVDPSDPSDMDELDEIVNRRFPKVPVVTTAANVSVQDVQRLMRLGVADFVQQPLARTDLVTAFQHAARLRAASEQVSPESQGMVFSFLKGGGGVGATTLAVQSAFALATRDRLSEPSVCLMDFDVQFGTAALYLDLDTKVTMLDLLESPDRLDATLLHNVISHHASGVNVLAAPRQMIPLEAISSDFAMTCLDTARRDYEFVLVDLPEAWTNWTYAILRASDQVFVVTQLGVAGVRQARHQIETLTAEGIAEDRIKIVLNRYEGGWGKSVGLKEAEKALGHKFDFLIPNDYKLVSEALNQGLLLTDIKRRSKVEKKIRSMMDESIAASRGGDERREPKIK